MSLTDNLILEQYDENQESFQIIKSILLEQLGALSTTVGSLVNSVESRIKSRESLVGKLNLKGRKYKSITDITDIVGARIVTFYMDGIEKYAARVEQIFDIDWDNSVDKRKIHNIDQFGYMSLHYIARIPTSLYHDEKHPLVNNLRFEIQIRSVLQHTWATIFHDIGYKNDIDVPKEYLRELNCLSGLLEIADKQFLSIRTSIDDYRRRLKNIIESGNLEDVELNGDSFTAYLDNGGFKDLNRRIAEIGNIDIEEVSLYYFLEVFKDLGINTLKDLDNIVVNYSDDAYNLAVRQFDGKDIDIITSATGPLTLITVYMVHLGAREKELADLMDTLYGKRKSNLSYASKIISLCEHMGIIKKGE